MSGRDRDLQRVVAASAVSGVVLLAVPVTVIRTIFAVVLCFALPGYALTQVAFARHHLETRQTLELTAALSLVSLVLGSLLLDVAPGGLSSAAWTALLVLIVLGASVVAAQRRRGLSAPAAPVTALWFGRRDAVLLFLATIAGTGAFVISRIPLPAPNALGYTALWMLPTGNAGDPRVTIGVSSEEQHATSYRLAVYRSSRGIVTELRIALKPGQDDRISLPLRNRTDRTSRVLTAILYKAGSADPYRQVTAHLPGLASVVR